MSWPQNINGNLGLGNDPRVNDKKTLYEQWRVNVVRNDVLVVIKKFYILGSDPKIDLLTEGSLMNVVITEIFTLSTVINGNFYIVHGN
jgi:hypothetical protein